MLKTKKATVVFAMLLAMLIPALMCGNAKGTVHAKKAEDPISSSVTSLEPKAVWNTDTIRYNALIGCYVYADADNSSVWLSKTGSFIGSASYMSTTFTDVYVPIEADGRPYYPYAALFSGSAQETEAVLSPKYPIVAPLYSVFGSNSDFIPDYFDSENEGEENVWYHGANLLSDLHGTISYQGLIHDFSIQVPILGYSYYTWDTGIVYEYDTAGGEKTMIFEVRCGPSRVSVKASTYVPCNTVNAFGIAK